MNELIAAWNKLLKTLGLGKDLDAVLRGLTKTLDSLQAVALSQVDIAEEQNDIIAEATAARDEADLTLERANRVADKLAKLLS
jgi:hypothetical protein